MSTKTFAIGDVVRVRGQSSRLTVLMPRSASGDVQLWHDGLGVVFLPAEVLILVSNTEQNDEVGS